MKKKVLSAMLVAAMTATMFAGCGSWMWQRQWKNK